MSTYRYTYRCKWFNQHVIYFDVDYWHVHVYRLLQVVSM